MRKIIHFFVFIFFMVASAGCAVHLEKKLRSDQEINGNQGYLVGESASLPASPTRLTKDVIDINAVDIKTPNVNFHAPHIKMLNPKKVIEKTDAWVKENLW